MAKKEPRLEAIIEIDVVKSKTDLFKNAISRIHDTWNLCQFASPFIKEKVTQHCVNIVNSLGVLAVMADFYEKIALSADDSVQCMNCKREFLYSQIKIRFPRIGIMISDKGINTTQDSPLMFLCEECDVPEDKKKIIIPGR